MTPTTREAGADTMMASPTAAPPPPAPTWRRKKGRPLPHLDHCLNCSRPTGETDNFCPNCGQENEDETVTLKPLVADALSEMASWDSKLVRTVLPLLFRPGFLTNEFLAGRRVRYLSPLKMYLVISAIFFLVLSSSNVTRTVQVDPSGISLHPSGSKGADAEHKPKAVPESPIHVIVGNGPGHTKSKTLITQGDLDILPGTVAAYEARQRVSPRRDGFWKALILRQVIKAKHDKQTFAQSVIQGLLEDLPKMMFGLLPVFALLLKIAYWRRRRLYIEHLVFALHSHAFAFVLLTLTVLTATHWAAAEYAAWAVFSVLLPVYLYAAMRRVYRQGWWKTGFKFLLLAYHYVLLLVLAFVLTAFAAFLLA